MSEQYKLYGGTPPHERIDTSLAAATSIKPIVKDLQAVVLAAFIQAGTLGMTDDEAEQRTSLSHQTLSARRRELVLKGLLVHDGRKRPTRSGRAARVHVYYRWDRRNHETK